MKVSELRHRLLDFPDDMEVKIITISGKSHPQKLDDENILLTSETAFVNNEAPEDEWDHEGGKIELGDGTQFVLINPIIL